MDNFFTQQRRIILHIDFNSFFASVEQQANPFLRGKPIAVSGKSKHSIDRSSVGKSFRYDVSQTNMQRTVVTTASIEAKALGVKTAMSSTEAKKICPSLILIPGDPRKYSDITDRFLKILRRYADAVEQFSTDEAFADVTIAAEDYLGAIAIAQHIREDIRQEIGAICTASIGIAANKVLAKLACESQKPYGLTVVPPNEAYQFVQTRPLAAICGIGPRIERRLNHMGIVTTKDLQRLSKSVLIQTFKQHTGSFLYHVAQGLGDDIVIEGDLQETQKSIGHSYTFPFSLQTEDEIKTHLLALCDRVARRLQKKQLAARALSVYIRYDDMHGTGGQRRFKEPFTDGLNLYQNAWHLIDYLRDPHQSIRLLGVGTHELLPRSSAYPLFRKQQKMHHIQHAIDTVLSKYGDRAIQRAYTLPTQFKERISGFHYDHK